MRFASRLQQFPTTNSMAKVASEEESCAGRAPSAVLLPQSRERWLRAREKRRDSQIRQTFTPKVFRPRARGCQAPAAATLGVGSVTSTQGRPLASPTLGSQAKRRWREECLGLRLLGNLPRATASSSSSAKWVPDFHCWTSQTVAPYCSLRSTVVKPLCSQQLA